ncbi:hypothetical protein P2R64_12175 [Priestia megaterium]|jgi:hypothetical protein|uniref:CBO0543 family protein n=1 Tax=Priestia megaterium TaxID=1404 RepID=UPI0021C0A56D|nr:CBO0543 family protein [Priestia megaterium]MCT9852633.1 hypothetical protein [Priestia megaterium]MDF1960820.1 hypothetical protein [Priestia megaterium]
MKNKFEKRFLRVLFILTLSALPFLFRKHPMKDSMLTFLLNGYTNGIVDRFVVNHKLIRYPVRYFRKEFKIHVLFDFLLYPTVSVIINQLTKNDKPLVVIYKILLFIFPMFFIELWAERKTNLITWRRSWKWYHTLLTLTVKSVLNRLMIGAIRVLDEKVEKSS